MNAWTWYLPPVFSDPAARPRWPNVPSVSQDVPERTPSFPWSAPGGAEAYMCNLRNTLRPGLQSQPTHQEHPSHPGQTPQQPWAMLRYRSSLIASSWAPCWPHEFCYVGCWKQGKPSHARAKILTMMSTGTWPNLHANLDKSLHLL